MVQLDGLDVAGKRVFVRVDFNEPLRRQRLLPGDRRQSRR